MERFTFEELEFLLVMLNNSLFEANTSTGAYNNHYIKQLLEVIQKVKKEMENREFEGGVGI